ncbi:DUF4847 family protein [uncultured Bacteroides sp.]|uniref:DUF4847 family protein n=1 Tax=uncultured Bacteroides sp. TaxID=162156 RepID=UPI002634DEC0|nr:DUF4847 family protein [uncultured Bacteroides sp.]
MKKYIFYLLMILPFLACGCNQEDDVNEIFANGQIWHWSGSYDTSNWKDDNNYKLTLNRSDLEKISKDQNVYNIQFVDDGTVTGNGQSFTFSGTWSADGGDSHAFYINIKPNRTPSGLDATFFDEISNAKFYRGDSKVIKLVNMAKNHYIQFYPKGFRD